jgi:hypothetical protein
VNRDQKIRERAYHLWVDEGMPEGREQAHWELASELVAIEENSDLMLKPNPLKPGEEIMPDEPGEPLEVEENLGEFPTLTDQGEEATTPIVRKRAARARKTEAPVLAAADAPAQIDPEPSPAPAARRRSAKVAKDA